MEFSESQINKIMHFRLVIRNRCLAPTLHARIIESLMMPAVNPWHHESLYFHQVFP